LARPCGGCAAHATGHAGAARWKEVECFVGINCGWHARRGAQVRLALPEGDNFERCAIEVWVKFRDEEALQRLSSHRQSGGERSVATILYLIAIQARAWRRECIQRAFNR